MRRGASPVVLIAALGALALSTTPAHAAPPTIELTTFSVTADSVTLEADLNPGEIVTSYRFEYGPDPCSSNPCTSVPVPEGKVLPKDVPEGKTAARVKAEVKGLLPATTYRFRFLAKNAHGKAESPDLAFTTYQPEQLFPEDCPNQAFRTGEFSPLGNPSALLPDCRAYEQVSPIDKNGLDVTGTYPTTKASIDGDAVIYATTSPIPGGEGAQDIPIYLSRFEGGNWSTEGLLLPASYGQRAGISGWTPDFSQVFTRAFTFTKPPLAAFFSRQSSDGSLSTIVPYAEMGAEAPFFFAAAPGDGSEVFFELIAKTPDAQLTPEATPGRDNLYVFDQDTQTTHLVGVLPDAQCESTPPCAPPGGSFAGPYSWALAELDKGGAASFHYHQEQRPISNDGSKVYFTAGDTGQIYLRRNPTSPGATTEHVSVSEKTNGQGPGKTDAAGTKPAAFMAVSKDGKLALFTSSEKLTNDATTGPEPTAPPAIARAETDGDPVDISFLPVVPNNAFGVAVDDEYVYWTDPKANAIGRAKLNGEEVEADFIDEGVDNSHYLAVDDEYVYWTNTGPLDEKGKPQDGEGTIGRGKLNGEDVEEDFIEGASNPRGIAVNDEFVYWANADNEGVETRAIGRAQLNGEKVAQGFAKVEIIPSAHPTPEGLTVNSSHIYTAVSDDQKNGYIIRWDLVGSNEKAVFDQQFTSLRGVAVDGEHLYWARENKGTIARAKLDFSEPEREWIKEAERPGGIAVDAEHLYWSANQELQPNPGNDLYRYDSEAPVDKRLTDLVVDEDDKNGADVRGVLGTSEDLSRVYFAANGVLTSKPNEEGEVAEPGSCVGETLAAEKGSCNLYLLQGKEVNFITRLQGNLFNLVPTPAVGGGSRFHKGSQASPDGSALIFSSSLSLGAYEHDGASELYRYGIGEGLGCISCNPTGAPPSGNGTGTIQPPLIPVQERPASALSRNLSADGKRVFFESTDALVGADVNGIGGCPKVGSLLQSFPACQDVYEWEANGTGSCESEAKNGGCIYLLSSGKSNYASFFLDASADGDHAFIITRAAGLVRQDGDDLLDVYDVKVNGGLAAQNEAPPIPCEGQGCKGEAPTPPGFDSPASANLKGPGNAVQQRKRPCPKGKRRVRAKGKSRCVGRKGRNGKGRLHL